MGTCDLLLMMMRGAELSTRPRQITPRRPWGRPAWLVPCAGGLAAGLAWAALSLAPGCTSDGGAGAGGSGLTASSGGTAGSGGASSSGSSSSSTTSGSTGGGGGTPLPCDDGFGFDPDPPGTGAYQRVTFTDPAPLTYVDLSVSGPTSPVVWGDGISTSDPWTWDWLLTGLEAGVYTFTFSAGDPQQQLASCQRAVIDTGPPLPPPGGGCEGKFCGDDDGQGGVCEDSPCRVVGTDLANPSPCGPSAQDSPWLTLDNAGCQDGNSCRIWCPYEKCSGCPNGTEAVWVPTSETSYENACHNACEALGACWDPQLSMCRNPGQCGNPSYTCPWE